MKKLTHVSSPSLSLSLSATINSIIITFIAITMLPTLGGLSDRSENLKIVRFKRPSLSCHFFKDSERLSCSCFHGASSAITGLRLYIVDDSSMEHTRKLRGRRQSSFCGITKRAGLIDVIRETSARISSPLPPPFRDSCNQCSAYDCEIAYIRQDAPVVA